MLSSPLSTISVSEVRNHNGCLHFWVALHQSHFLVFFNYNMRLLSTLLWPGIFRWIMSRKMLYIQPHIICPRYWSSLFFIVILASFSFSILLDTSKIVTLSSPDISLVTYHEEKATIECRKNRSRMANSSSRNLK